MHIFAPSIFYIDIMKISPETKISAIIKENENAIDVIASVNRHFRKLKNPFLRKTLGSRVTVKEAASIGGISPDLIMEKLRLIGFEIESNSADNFLNNSINSMGNIEPETGISVRTTLDVRDQIAKGMDPMKLILKTSEEIKEGESFLLINSFEPLPIMHLLKESGFSSKLVKSEANLVHVYFTRERNSTITDSPENFILLNENDFNKKLDEYGENITRIDVRDLEMPEPMVNILEETENLKNGFALYVDHKKTPQYLLPELENRQFKVYGYEIDDDNVKLLIFKDQ